MKKILLTTLQILVTVFALYWVFKDPQKRHDMAAAVGQANLWWVLAAIVGSSLSPITATLRWWMLLRVQDIRLSLIHVARLYMVGMFFNLFLLGSTGGDAVKLFYLLRQVQDRPRRAGAILAVIMDRLIGLFALIMLSAVFIAWRYSWLTQTPTAAKVVHAFCLLLGSALVGLVVTFVTAQFGMVNYLPPWMPARSKFIEMAAAIQLYTRAWGTSLTAILISFVGHTSFILTYYFSARALQAVVSFIDMAVVIPIVNTFVSLPVSMSGVGIRENLMNTLLGDLCGVPQAKSVPLAMLGFLSSVIFYGMLGGLFYLSYRSKAGAPPKHVEEVEAKEESAALPVIVEEANRARGTADA